MSSINLNYQSIFERFEISPLSKSGLIWKPKVENNKRDVAWNIRYAGKDCGNITIDQDGRQYYVSSISQNNNKRKIFNHKVVYALHHKKDLDGKITIAHIDGNTMNNNPENLMESLNSEHFHSSNKLHVRNKSGCPGVHYCFRKRKHIAQITFKLKKILIGSFNTQEEAVQARKDYEKKLYGN